jgi:ATP-dependent helicase/nuclease subunit B
VDIAQIGDDKYIRVVDYKSSNKTIKLSNIYYGIQLQLLAYIDAICSGNESFKPAGIFYLKLDDPIARVDRKLTADEIQEKIIKALRMNGLIIKDLSIVEAMDSDFNIDKSGSVYESSIISLKKDKSGKYSKMPVISEIDFQNLRNHMKKTLRDIGNEIISGNVKNEPLYRSGTQSNPCDYCAFQKICLFDPSLGNKARRISELDDESIIELINEEK